MPAIPILLVIMVSLVGLSFLTNQTGTQMESMASQEHAIATNIQTMTTAASGDSTGSTDPADSASKGVSCTYRGDGSRSCGPSSSTDLLGILPVIAIALIGGLAIYFVLMYVTDRR